MAAATRWTVAGVLGGVLTVVGAAMFAALTLNWRGTIDATYHLDYIYQLADGNLPAPYGVRFTPDGPLPHERQYASAHPPLYYALVLALAGGAEPADWVRVVLTGRLLNVALGAVTVLLLGWAGWSLGGRSRHRLAVATAATGALSVSFVRFAGEIYGDVLLTALATAGLVFAIRMLRAGPSRRRVLATAAVCGLGMLTKATFVVVLLLCAGAVLIAVTIHLPGPGRVRAALLRVAPVLAVPAATSGWFYLRNLALSGSWFRSTPRVPVGDRPYRTLEENLTRPDFYLIVPDRLLGQEEVDLGALTNYQLSRALFVTLALLAVVAAGRWWSARRGAGAPPLSVPSRAATTWAALVPLGALIGMYAVQLAHTVGYGNDNIRYFLPASIALGLLAGLACLAARGAGGLVAASVMVVLLGGTVRYSAHLAERFGVDGERGWLAWATAAAAQNDLPAWPVWSALAVSVFGVLIVVVAWRGLAATQRRRLGEVAVVPAPRSR